jgi:hypothetical protein
MMGTRMWRVVRSFVLSLMALALTLPSGAVQAGASRPWPLGTFTRLPGGVTDCPSGSQCQRFGISNCPNVSENAGGELAVSSPSGTPRGTVMFFSGGTATSWWSDMSPLSQKFMARLRSTDGFQVVQVRWVQPWLFSAPGEDAGSGHLACRPATLIEWVHEHVFARLGLRLAAGSCGFCITGSSGGASEVSYAISFYGLDGILDGEFPTSGPPHAAQVKGCQPGFPGYGYGQDAGFIDGSYGFLDPQHDPGPCALQDPGFVPRWQAESVDTGGNDFSHPTTRIEFIIGGRDHTAAPAHARDYRNLLKQDPLNDVTWTFVATMPHDVQLSQDGLSALEATLLKS